MPCWALALSGATGFGSFLTYLAYGYLDQWHGVVTLCLLPVYVAGMAKAWAHLSPGSRNWRTLLRGRRLPEEGRVRLMGRRLLLTYGAGLVAAGMVIALTGMTRVLSPRTSIYWFERDRDLRGIRSTRALDRA